MIKKVLFLIISWFVYIFADYFLLPYFVRPVSWLLICLVLLILSIRQILKTIRHRKNLKPYRIINLSVTVVIFVLTFYQFNSIPKSIVEKIDWKISYKKRMQIVEEVKRGDLKANSEMNNGICRLPFSFPIVSNGGNDIWISENEKGKTIRFWISNNYFESPQIYFIYTNDKTKKQYFQDLIKNKPQYNWQLQGNWYRIMEDH